MLLRLVLLLIICHFLFLRPGIGQSYHVRSVTPEDGLSHGYISSMFQDSRGFVWIGTFYGLNRFDGYAVKAYIPNQLDPQALHASIITCIAEDRNGMLWIGTDNGPVVFNPFSEKFANLAELNPDISSFVVRDIAVDRDNNIWYYTIGEGSSTLCHIVNDNRLKSFLCDGKSSTPSPAISRISLPQEFNQIRFFFSPGDTTCLIANQRGQLLEINLLNKTFKSPSQQPSFVLNKASAGTVFFPDHDFSDPMQLDERYSLLKAPDGTGYITRFFDPHIYRLEKDRYPETSEQIGSLEVIATLNQPVSPARIIDRSGKIWVGTIGDGVRIAQPVSTAIRYDFPDVNLCNPALMPDNSLWAGMYAPDKALDLLARRVTTPIWSGCLPRGASVNAAFYDEPSRTVFLVISQDNKLSLNTFDIQTRQLTTIENLNNYTNNPAILYKDSKGGIWVASQAGEVIRYRGNGQTTEHWDLSYLIPEKNDHGQQMSRCIAEDRNGRIWIASDAGLTRISFSGTQLEFRAISNHGENGPVFRSNWIFSVYPDPHNPDMLWLGTMSGGLAQFNIQSEKVWYVTDDNNPGFDVVTGIVPDYSGNLWLATNKGVFKYLPATNVFVDFSKLKNIPRVDINAAACLKKSTGDVLFGGTNGLLAINPADITPQTADGNLVVTEIEINRQPLASGIAEGKIRLNDRNQYELELSHEDNFVSVSFSTPGATDPEALFYRYKMDDLNDDWIYLGQTHSLVFTGLSPGNYMLEIQAIGGGESWASAKSLRIPVRVAPPWYRRNLALLIYAILLAAIIGAGFRYQRKRMALEFTADLNQKEMERLQSMDDFKNRFFAYIAHEFKTPLTIIMGASEQIRRLVPADNTRQYPEAIVREGNNMLNLINEMIDVTRLQDKSIRPNYDHRNMVEFLRNVTVSYKSLADLNGIHLEFVCSLPELLMDMDPLRTQYILNNLLSNAIQHTPPNGKITVSLEKPEGDKAIICVADNGTGIAPEDIPHIFEKYYRVSEVNKQQNNFGLGLSFVKELTELLNGSVSVSSKPGIFTAFTLELPLQARAGVPVSSPHHLYPAKTETLEFTANVTIPLNAPHILIVDDNPAILSYLKSVLKPHFRLSIAKNGRDGLEIAIQEIPDLILTDVMMPVMDGIEMTNLIKAHQLTSHVPVIMLSAKNEIADRIKGQEQGADLYLAKPFNDQELVLAIHNLNKLQQKWKERYAAVHTGAANLESVPDMPEGFNRLSVATNDTFMQRVLNTFEENYAREKFDATEIAALLNISKAQLYRKISQISEESVMGMLRNYRLGKAVEFLENQPNMSTKEVAYKVGFKEYSHFSASFKKYFNVAPSEWRKSGRKS